MFGRTSLHSRTNDELVTNLINEQYLRSEVVEAVMRRVDRARYITTNPYANTPQSIGYNATISAPHMHAIALELLQRHLKPGNKVLDVGSGSGYLTTCMALMVGPAGRVIGIEHIKQIVRMSVDNVMRDQPELLRNKNIIFVVGDGRAGYPDGAPYDAIHVGAASAEVPLALENQLALNGRLLVPVGAQGGIQHLMIIDKDAKGRVKRRKIMMVAYVPLTDSSAQLSRINF